MLATIEQFAPERLLCGLGSGWMREEFDALDIPFAGRGVRMDEYVAALRTIWSGTPAAFDGTVYQWEAAGFNPAPTAPIPILLGGHVAPARARALRIGDGRATILTALDDPSLAGSLAWLRSFREELEAAGRDPGTYEVPGLRAAAGLRRPARPGGSAVRAAGGDRRGAAPAAPRGHDEDLPARRRHAVEAVRRRGPPAALRLRLIRQEESDPAEVARRRFRRCDVQRRRVAAPQQPVEEREARTLARSR